MPKLTVDGMEIEVPAGTTVLQAALSRGKEIPHYCYHEGLSIAGNCRMCLVEVETAPKLVIGCQTPVQDGMVVNTNNDRVREAQAAIMEFLLINHPLDCPICDQAGECRLQDYAVEHGTGISRNVEPKQTQNKAIDIGRHVMLDQERCIQCSRCIRFCDEITETGELSFFQRGERTIIGISPGRRLDNPYSGNVVDICPVGALTLKEFRFTNRVWYLQNTPSICAGCSRGCNVMVAVGNQQQLMTTRGQLDDRIKRVVPRVNEEVNAHWICDEGRLSYKPLEKAEPLRSAQAPAGEAVEWSDAVGRAAAALQSGRAGAIFSPRLTNETYFAWNELLTSLGKVRRAVRRIERGADDALLLRADRGANSRGAEWILGATGGEVELTRAIDAGQIDTLVVVGDVLMPDDTFVLEDDLRSRLDNLIFVGPFDDSAARQATIALPCCAWAEEDGTMVNFEGRVQQVRRCHLPRGEGRPGWRVAADLAAAAGFDPPARGSAAEVFEAIASNVKEFHGLDAERVGLLGMQAIAAVSSGE